jgi:hypothetical protein
MKKLKKIETKNPFKVPENYFEEANIKILSATTGYSKEVKKTVVLNRFRPFLLIAASVTGFIILSYSAIKLLGPYKATNQLSDAISIEYSQPYLNDFDIITLEETASSLNLEAVGPDVSSKDIIDYLLMENIEINDIYEQL